MEYLVGVLLAAAFIAFAITVGFTRDRAFAPLLLIVVATYYILFAVMGASMSALLNESLGAGAFIVVAVAGFKKNPWLIVAGLVGHGVFDFVHPLLIHNPGVPVWWPGFCLAFDGAAGVAIAVLLSRHSAASASQTTP